MTEDPSVPKTQDQERKDEFDFGEPAEVLVELAKKGEIDPWDIDIAKTTEKFLKYIDSLEKRDLRIPARTLLYASVLLRMKSDSMEEQKVEEPEPEMEEPEAVEVEEMGTLPRPPVRRHTKRPVTLDELISELKKAEMVGRRKAMRDRWPGTEEKALDLSHDEGIEDRIKALGPILDDMFMSSKKIILRGYQQQEQQERGRGHQLCLAALHGSQKTGVAGAGRDIRGSVCEQASMIAVL